MKKIILLFSALALTITSCDKDDNDDKITNSFIKISGNEKPITSGLAVDYGLFNSLYDGGDVYNIDLSFYTEQLTYNLITDKFEGKGLEIYFEAFSSVATKLATGVYVYTQTSNSPFTFDDVSITEFADGNENTIEINSVTITITKSEKDYYELTFQGLDSEDNEISGKFKGKVNYNVAQID
jgi:hypothetical protein